MTNDYLLLTMQFVELNTLHSRVHFKNEQRKLNKVLTTKY